VKTTGQIISVFQGRQGFPFASAERPEQEASGAASGPRRVRAEKCEASVEITASVETRFKAAVSEQND